MTRPFSQACENNKEPILAILRELFGGVGDVVEIGSGTGQHAVHFAAAMPWLQWQPTDRAENLPGIRAWRDDAQLPNLREPLLLDVEQPSWPVTQADAVFSANTAHIMSWPQVERFVAGVGRLLPAGGWFCLYGPFNYDGGYTSASNADFDAWLRQRDPHSGLRDVEAMHELAAQAGLQPEADHAMPANNRLLVWRKR
jgi:cyclopropane fatty-acyl-phospholipid synthase-like methyltransferase